jgi:hypothetical protein
MGAIRRAVRHLIGRLNKQSIQELIPEVTPAEERVISRSLGISMTSPERIWANLVAIKYLAENRIPGDLVEFGVWRGGGLFSMLEGLSIYEPDSLRQVIGFDTFSGMTAPSVQDREISSGEQATELLRRHQNRKDSSVVWAIGSLQDVSENLRQAKLQSNLKLIEGDVALTLQGSGITQIALARLDTDWYESTKLELEFTWPRLSVGGVLIIDDYGHWDGAKLAFDEFIHDLPQRPLIHRIDYTARLVIKRAN